MKKILLTILITLNLYSNSNIDFEKLSIIPHEKEDYMEYVHSLNLEKLALKKYFQKPNQNNKSKLLNALAYDYYYDDKKTAEKFYLDLIDDKKINISMKLKVIDGLLRIDKNNLSKVRYSLRSKDCLMNFKQRTQCFYYLHTMKSLQTNMYPRILNRYSNSYGKQLKYMREVFEK